MTCLPFLMYDGFRQNGESRTAVLEKNAGKPSNERERRSMTEKEKNNSGKKICICLKENILPVGKNGVPAAERKTLSHRLLYEAASLCLGQSGRLPASGGPEADSWRIEEGKYGKPYFSEHPELHFSISHSGTVWCCAFSASPVGLDIQMHGFTGKKVPQEKVQEQLRLRQKRIADRFFHPSERLWLKNGGDFFDVWAAKESYVKYIGEGMHRSFESFATADENGLLPYVKGEGPRAQLRHLPAPAGCSLCLCAERIGGVEVLSEMA